METVLLTSPVTPTSKQSKSSPVFSGREAEKLRETLRAWATIKAIARDLSCPLSDLNEGMIIDWVTGRQGGYDMDLED